MFSFGSRTRVARMPSAKDWRLPEYFCNSMPLIKLKSITEYVPATAKHSSRTAAL